ncbi:MAG: type VI secretion system tip protein VgrG [Deltaproteobacteria bacterium]|jgi:type VI secretion system VgrG family protein|nr:type VI secretion system tip protein VgrG [Deltaproteobacteria bacterium]
MPEISQTRFEFVFLTRQELKAQVVKFSGRAGLNSLYSLKVLLLIPANSLEKADWPSFYATPCALTIEDDGFRRPLTGAQASQTSWTGLLSRIRVGARLEESVLVEVELTPWLGLLAGQTQNRIHLGQNCLGVLRDSFKFGGLETNRFRFAAKRADYPQKDFIFQYEEDLLAFVWRTLAHDGLGLYYEPGSEGEVAVIVDHNTQFPPLLFGDKELVLTCATTSGLSPDKSQPTAYNFQVESSLPPQTLLLRDYNWEEPNRPLEVQLEVSPRGQGEVHLYGENFASNEEGSRLARIRREEILANSEIYRLTTSVPGFKPGLTFTLKGHPWGGFNDRYLTVATEFSGAQTGGLSSRLGLDLGHEDLSLKHELICQKLATPYRPPTMGQPRKIIEGSVTAWIDGAGSGESPELDKYGRYKVLLPQDISGRGGGKASAWVRMAQPYVGNGYGQHFPLTPGAEVLLTFVDGNPDRPVISGAVPNAETKSLITSSTAALSGLGTKGGGSLLFHDKPGKQKVVLAAGSNRGSITISAGSPSSTLFNVDDVDSFSVKTATATVNKKVTLVGSESTTSVSNSKFLKAATILQTLRGAASLFLVNLGPDKDSYGEVPSAIIDKSKELIDFSINKIALMADFLGGWEGFDSFRSSLISPHDNLIELAVSDEETKSTMRAKQTDNWTIVNISQFLGYALKCVDEYQGNKEAWDEVGEDPNATRKAKTAARTLNIGSSSIDVAMDFLANVCLFKGMIGSGSAKGVLIQNEDSYVTARAETYAALSGSGPVILESTGIPLAELLRHEEYEDTAPASLLAFDGNGQTDERNYESDKSILLLSDDLVRAKGEEIILEAYQGFSARTPGVIQLIAGVKETEAAKLIEHDAKLKAVRMASNGFEAARKTGGGAESALKLGYYSTAADYLKDEVPSPKEEAIKEGILIRALGAKDIILVQTKVSNSRLDITQGDPGACGGYSDSRGIFMDHEGLIAQEDSETKLHLEKGVRAVLRFNENIGLKVEKRQVSLGLSANSALKLSPTKVELVGDSKVSLKADNNSVDIGGGAVSFSAGPTSVDVGPGVITLG